MDPWKPIRLWLCIAVIAVFLGAGLVGLLLGGGSYARVRPVTIKYQVWGRIRGEWVEVHRFSDPILEITIHPLEHPRGILHQGFLRFDQASQWPRPWFSPPIVEDAYQMASAIVKNHPAVHAQLGMPISVGYRYRTGPERENEARFGFEVNGPLGRGSASALMTYVDGKWRPIAIRVTTARFREIDVVSGGARR
jgi:hypothetical protein